MLLALTLPFDQLAWYGSVNGGFLAFLLPFSYNKGIIIIIVCKHYLDFQLLIAS